MLVTTLKLYIPKFLVLPVILSGGRSHYSNQPQLRQQYSLTEMMVGHIDSHYTLRQSETTQMLPWTLFVFHLEPWPMVAGTLARTQWSELHSASTRNLMIFLILWRQWRIRKKPFIWIQVSLCRSWEQIILVFLPVIQSKNKSSSKLTIQQGRNALLSIHLLEVLPHKASSSQPKS
jgi:hypothetical protein